MGPNVEFAFQHDARFISKSADGKKEIISLYDNSAHGTENGHGHEVHFYKYSRGKTIEVNTETWEAKIVQVFNPPDNLLSKSQGSTQVLPNGNVVVNWGSEGALTEFTADGTPIFHFYMDSGLLGQGVENYRGYRYNWTGFPNEAPAIVALQDEVDKSTSIYVSWNGDTETKTWRFYEVNDAGRRSYLGESKRRSFETVLKVEGLGVKTVQAEALDVEGRVLVDTSVVKPEVFIEQFQGKSTGERKKLSQQTGEGILSWPFFRGQRFFRADF